MNKKCLALLGPTSAVCFSAAASHRSPFRPIFGLTGFVANQTARLTVANVTSPPVGASTPCSIDLRFFDTGGSIVVNGDGTPYQTQTTIPPGPDVSPDVFSPRDKARLVTRVALRPLVKALSSQSAGNGCLTVAGLEIFDSASGPMRDVMTMQPQHPTRMTLSFVDPAAQTVIGPNGNPIKTEVSFAAGSPAFLDFVVPARSARAMLRVIAGLGNSAASPPRPLSPVLNLEPIGSASGATTIIPSFDPAAAQGPPI